MVNNLPCNGHDEDLIPGRIIKGLSWWLSGKESAFNTGDSGSVPGLRRSCGGGHGNPLQHCCLENTTDRGAFAGYSPWGCKELDPSEVTEHAYRITKIPRATDQLSPGAITRDAVHCNEDPDAATKTRCSQRNKYFKKRDAESQTPPQTS